MGTQSGWEPVEKQQHSSWLVWRTNYGMESYTSGSSLHIHLSCILATWSLLFGSSLVTDAKWLYRSRPVCSALVSSLEYPTWQGLIDLCVGSLSRDLRADLLGNGIQIWCIARGQHRRRLSHPENRKLFQGLVQTHSTRQNKTGFGKGSLVAECTQCNRFTIFSHSGRNLHVAATLNCGYCPRDLQKAWRTESDLRS